MKKNILTFFDSIDSELKAYLLGYLYGDGNLYKRRGNEYSIGLSSIDEYIVKLFRDSIYNKAKISKVENIKFDSYKCKIQYRVRLYSKYLFERLNVLGLDVRKTYKELDIPKEVNNSLFRHFLRGLFDSDGTCGVYYYKRKDRKNNIRVKPTFHITSNTYTLLSKIQTVLSLEYNINIPLYEDNKGYFYLKSGSYKETRKLYNLLYNNSEYYTKRKKIKFHEVTLTPREFRELKDLEPRNA